MWESAGRRVSGALDSIHAALIIGDDPLQAAAVALGLARMQALRRRVALTDVLGDESRLERLVPGGDDPHGVTDVLLFGVSLGKVARQVIGISNLFLLPGGSESPLDAELLEHPGWKRLSDTFRESAALLLVVVPSGERAVEALAAHFDGVVLVGSAEQTGPSPRVLAEVRGPIRRTPHHSGEMDSAPRPVREMPRRTIPEPPREVQTPLWKSRPALLGGALVGVLAAGLVIAQMLRSPPASDAASNDSAVAATPIPTPGTAPPAGELPEASAWTVEVATFNTLDGAMIRLRALGDSVPGATITPMRLGADSVTWYRVRVGAAVDSAGAIELLDDFRNRGIVAAAAGRVVRAPFALILDSLATGAVASRIEELRTRGAPAYALADRRGIIRIYAGAFESAGASQQLIQRLDSLNISATLATRVGRAF
jgi:hypothetical protein